MGLQKNSNFAPPLTEPRLQGAVTTWPISSGFSTERFLMEVQTSGFAKILAVSGARGLLAGWGA